ncbi:MAG: 1-deoxy-D-xylulose-5-phosphate reductoisomerase, partial [Clostridiales bacterium]|nr:1-deoxy-D-xylulose-5-phosphate reductoisomerase [Clostridiales bacterium]
MRTRKIALLGSTGSIGTQTLDVVSHDEHIEVVGLSAHRNIDLLEEQIKKYHPKVVCVMDETKAQELSRRMASQNLAVEVTCGMEGLIAVATLEEAEVVVTAVVGMIGLLPTLEAIKKGKIIALANKETLVTAGDLVMETAKAYNVPILPVDSEHSAIFQCL